MSNTFQFLTYSGFRISTGAGYEILVDPFLDDNPDTQFQSTDFEKVDLILATHGAYDHVGDTGKSPAEPAHGLSAPMMSRLCCYSRGYRQSRFLPYPGV